MKTIFNIRNSTRRISFMGLMLAIAAALSWLEHALPQPPFLPPNVRLGLSNIVTMYCFFFVGQKSAALLNALKSLFVALMRGPFAGVASFLGGMASVLLLMLLVLLFGDRLSFMAASVCGAVAHNLGQLLAAAIIVRTNIFAAYLPVLIVSGVAAGIATGLLLKAVAPLLKRIDKT